MEIVEGSVASSRLVGRNLSGGHCDTLFLVQQPRMSDIVGQEEVRGQPRLKLKKRDSKSLQTSDQWDGQDVKKERETTTRIPLWRTKFAI